MHEYSRCHKEISTGASDRSFGIAFATAFLIIALYPLLGGESLRIWSLIVAGASLLLALLHPRALAPANKLWMKSGELLRRTISSISLGFLFYGVVLPIGLVMRLLDKDPLRLRPEPEAESYWIRREPPGPAAESLNNQR